MQQRDFIIEMEDAKQVDSLETAQFVAALPVKLWITTVDYALAAGISEETVRGFIEQGVLPAKTAGVAQRDGRNKYLIARARAIQFFKSNTLVK